MTPKQKVKRIYAMAVLDYYESFCDPAYFIRLGVQGKPLSDICPTPREAWHSAMSRLQGKGILAGIPKDGVCGKCDGTGEICFSSTSYGPCPECKEKRETGIWRG